MRSRRTHLVSKYCRPLRLSGTGCGQRHCSHWAGRVPPLCRTETVDIGCRCPLQCFSAQRSASMFQLYYLVCCQLHAGAVLGLFLESSLSRLQTLDSGLRTLDFGTGTRCWFWFWCCEFRIRKVLCVQRRLLGQSTSTRRRGWPRRRTLIASLCVLESRKGVSRQEPRRFKALARVTRAGGQSQIRRQGPVRLRITGARLEATNASPLSFCSLIYRAMHLL